MGELSEEMRRGLEEYERKIEAHLQQIRDTTRALPYVVPPSPWTGSMEIHASGVYAGGWGVDGSFWLLSLDGYSRSDVKAKKMHSFTHNNRYDEYVNQNETLFTNPQSGEVIPIFGINTGDGILTARTSPWRLEPIHPNWPLHDVALLDSRNSPQYPQNSASQSYFKLELVHLAKKDWIRCGFSPDGTMFAIVGEPGMLAYFQEPLIG